MPIVGQSIESTQLDFVSGSATSETFRLGTVSNTVRRLTLTTDTDVYINFDEDADDTCFVLQPGCPLVFDSLTFTIISAQGVNSGGTLYILAQRN
jgi:hypothetical protein